MTAILNLFGWGQRQVGGVRNRKKRNTKKEWVLIESAYSKRLPSKRADEAYNEKCDLWSLGVVFLEMLRPGLGSDRMGE